MNRSSRIPLVPLLPLLGATALLVAACGSDPDSAPVTDPSPATLPPPATAPPVELDGRAFLSTAVEGYDLVADSVIRLEFADGSLSANAGCNTILGGYEVVDDRLVAATLASTEMGCEPDLMAQDRWLTDILTLEPRLSLEGDTLTLRGAGGAVIELTDREVADPDLPLEGTRWVLDGIRTQDAVSSVPAGVVASITFEDGRASVEAGCNQGSSDVEIGDGVATFGPMALTRMMCDDDAMSVESAVVTTLEGDVTWLIDADRLTLDSADTPMEPSDGEMGGTGLTFVADES